MAWLVPFVMLSPYNDPLCVVTLYCFSRWSFLNLNHVKLQKIFMVFLHIMIKHNSKNKIIYIHIYIYIYIYMYIHFLFILWWLEVYLHENNTCEDIFKDANIFQKWLKWKFLTFMKFIIVISHFIINNLNQICEPFEKFDNFHVINGFFLQC